jgi:hypothetical protein
MPCSNIDRDAKRFLSDNLTGNVQRNDETYAAVKIHDLGKNQFTDEHGWAPGSKKTQFPRFKFKSVTPMKSDFSFIFSALRYASGKIAGQQ